MIKRAFVSTVLLGAASLPALLSAQLAMAQDNAAPADSGAAQQNVLQDIIVTANRREEASQRVPTAITAFTAESLRQANIASNQDLAGKVPSLVVGQASGQRDTQTFNIRGQGSTYGGGPGVAAYFSEVPLPQREDTVGQLGTGTLFYDLQNVQVLKGPQGTLFGRNTTGGAVLFEPAMPKNAFDGYVQFQVGNYGDHEVEGAINVPIVPDRLMLRVAGRFADRDGYTREVRTGRDLDDRHYWSGRIGLTWKPTDTIENYLMITNVKLDQNGTGSVFVGFNSARNPTSPTNAFQGSAARTFGIPLLTQVLAEQQARGPRATELNIVPLEEQRLFMVTDKLTIALSDELTLRNIASYARYKTRAVFDQDGSRLAISDTGPLDANSTDAHQWTEELQLQGKLLDDHLNFAVGGYYENSKPDGPQLRGGSNNNAFSVISQGENRTSKGLYSQASLDFGAVTPALEGLRLTGGYRYTWDRKDARAGFRTATGCVIAAASPPDCELSANLRSKAPTWLLSLDYQVMRDVMVYAKASRGYKSGGYNYNGTNPERLLFQPEYVTTYEGGIKSQFRLGDMPVRLNADYYYTKYKDIQKSGTTAVTLPSGAISAGSATVNAGSAHIQGIEVEGTISPVRNFTISASYAYTKAKYDDFKFAYVSGGVILIDDKTDLPFSFTPKNQYSVTAAYKIQLDDWQSITPSLVFSHVDRYYTQITRPEQEPFGYLPESNLLNLRLDWQNVAGRPVDFAFFMTNVANKTFPVQLQANYGKNGAAYGGGIARYIYSEPRMWGFQLRYRFGQAAN